MKILSSIDALSEIHAPVVLAIGVFDGMHLGHQAVLQAALDSAMRIGGVPVVATFDPHPAMVLRPESAPRLLTPLNFRLHLMERCGIGHALVISFDAAFAAMEAEDFVLKLCRIAPRFAGICIGEGWIFGNARKGNARLLQTLGMKNGFFTSAVAPVVVDGEVVSSTLIRESLAAGNLSKAARLLGREFSIRGSVVRGAGMGHKLGFPTANIATGNEQYPPDGVYAIQAAWNGNTRSGVANIGIRPTISGDGCRILEAHLFDFSGNLYGAEMEISFCEFIRPERKFENQEALCAQIHKDIGRARKRLQNSKAAA